MKWLYGYLYVRLRGNSPERFLNLCNARAIPLWDIEKTEKGYGFCISAEEFKRLIPVAHKTKTRPYIIKRNGLPFYIKRIKPRKGLWIGGLLFFAVIYLLSSFIWEIQIQGQYTYTEEALLKYLQSIDVYAGMRKKKISCPDIETAIRETYTDIGWVSAELKGSKLFVRIQETNMPTLYETDTTPRHLVAQRSGVVESIITRTGTPLVKKGDIVEKGDILISGVVAIYGDSGECIKKDAVRADGDVMIRSETSYYNEIAKKYQEKSNTGEKVAYKVCALGYQIETFSLPEGITDMWEKGIEWLKQRKNGKSEGVVDHMETGRDLLIENKEIYLNNSLKLPVKLVRKTEIEYVLTKEEYTKEEMERILQKKFEHYLEKLMEKGVIIGENSVKIIASESLGTISGSFVIYEKSDKFQKVSDDEWRIVESDEYSGNNN